MTYLVLHVFFTKTRVGTGEAYFEQMRLLRKVQNCKLAMIFSGGIVISASGFDFIIEIADGFAFAVEAYSGCPSLFIFVPAYTLES